MRRAHVLRTLSRGLTRMRLLFIDVETTTIKETQDRLYQGFRLMTANLVEYRPETGWMETVEKDFYNQQDFYDWFDSILHRKSTLYVISANIWFDLRNSGLFHYLTSHRWEVKIFFIKGFTNIIKLKQEPYTVCCLNMQQFIPRSVKKMGQLIGLEKFDVDVKDKDDKLIMGYCRRDVDIITETFKLWVKFLDDNDLGRFCYTLAGQSFTAFRHRFLNKKIYIHANEFISNFERECYYGGRVELFRRGDFKGEKIYKLDINSQYPYVMREYPMPVKWRGTEHLPSMVTLRWCLWRYICFAKVALNTNEPVYPQKGQNKLLFPTGRFVTYLSHPELIYAYEHGHIYEIEYLIYYDKAVIFREYVDNMFVLRRKYKDEHNDVFQYLVKIMMNALYGKFAQRVDTMILEEEIDKELYEVNTIIDRETGKRYRELILGFSRKVFQEGNEDSINTMIAIPAMITSLARIYLWELIQTAGRENVYYCDTDSIFTNTEGYQNLGSKIHPIHLGLLALEADCENLVLWGPKDYIFGSETVLKGIRKDSVKQKDGSYDQIHFPGFKGDLRHGLDKPYGIVKIKKSLKRIYEKGTVNPDGTITPFVRSEF